MLSEALAVQQHHEPGVKMHVGQCLAAFVHCLVKSLEYLGQISQLRNFLHLQILAFRRCCQV